MNCWRHAAVLILVNRVLKNSLLRRSRDGSPKCADALIQAFCWFARPRSEGTLQRSVPEWIGGLPTPSKPTWKSPWMDFFNTLLKIYKTE